MPDAEHIATSTREEDATDWAVRYDALAAAASLLRQQLATDWPTLITRLSGVIPSDSSAAATLHSLALDGQQVAAQFLRALVTGLAAETDADRTHFYQLLATYRRTLDSESEALTGQSDDCLRSTDSALIRDLCSDVVRLRLAQLSALRALGPAPIAVTQDSPSMNVTSEIHPTVVLPQLSSGPITHVVILLHGIRTQAPWFEKVASVLRRTKGLEVFPIRYGYFDAIKFLCPVLTRSGPAKDVEREIRMIRFAHPAATVSVLSHSFGTYTICRVLYDNPDIRIDRLVLCGSVVRQRFHWDRISEQIRGRVLNDCGTNDIWPLLATGVTWGYGPSGTFGFGSYKVRDRFHPFPHSGFFDEQFVKEYWVPYLLYGQVVDSALDPQRPTPPLWQSAILFAKPIAVACMTMLTALYWWLAVARQR